MPQGVDGFIPGSHLSTSKIKNLSFCFPVGTPLTTKVVEFDKENKKIVLSVIAALQEDDPDTIGEYIQKHKLDKVTVDDIIKADVGKFDSSDFNIYDSVKPKHDSRKDQAPKKEAAAESEEPAKTE